MLGKRNYLHEEKHGVLKKHKGNRLITNTLWMQNKQQINDTLKFVDDVICRTNESESFLRVSELPKLPDGCASEMAGS